MYLPKIIARAELTITQAPEAGTILSGNGDSIDVTITVDDNNGNTIDTTWTVTLIAENCDDGIKEVVFVQSETTNRDSVVIAAIKGYDSGAAYNVTVLSQNVITADSLDFFNAADVVIMGRSIGSSDVGSGKAVWDAITAPVFKYEPLGA